LGVKPNLILVFLTVTIFFVENFFLYFLLVMAAYLSFKANPILDFTVIILCLIMSAAFWVNKIFPGQALFNLLFLIFLNTTFFYLIVNYSFIINHPFLFFGEMFYNLVLAVILYETIVKINIKKI
jgi:hypothetical protein